MHNSKKCCTFAANFEYMEKVTNPFIIRGAIPEAYFCDREKETERLVRYLTNGKNVVLHAPRRIGKSKLIEHCFEQPAIKGKYYTIFVDILQTGNLQEFTFEFGKAVFEATASLGDKMMKQFALTVQSLHTEYSIDPFTGFPKLSMSIGHVANPMYTIEEVFRFLEQADKPCIVAIDEFQRIADYPEKNVEALLRSHIQHMRNARFIFSGSERHLLEEMFNSSSRPFYNSTSYMELAPIPEEKYVDFVCYWFEQYDKHIDKELVQLIYSIAEGNTYVMQRICHELFDELAAGATADRQALTTVVNGIIESETPRYARILSHVPERQQSLLFAIAKEGKVQKIMSGPFLRKYHLMSSSAVQNAIKHLLELDLVTLENKQYTVADIFLRMYINRISEK